MDIIKFSKRYSTAAPFEIAAERDQHVADAQVRLEINLAFDDGVVLAGDHHMIVPKQETGAQTFLTFESSR